VEISRSDSGCCGHAWLPDHRLLAAWQKGVQGQKAGRQHEVVFREARLIAAA